MGGPDLDALRREALADLPQVAVDPARVPEFVDSFGSAVIETADMAALLLGSLPPADLAAAVEHMVRIVVDAIATAADHLDVTGHPWIVQGQRWAVGAFFDRMAEVSDAMGAGGSA